MVSATNIQRLTRRVPLPGRTVRTLLERWDHVISYPPAPLLASSRSGRERFEIRDFHEYVQRNIYFLGYYEFWETRLVQELLRPGDTFVDVGANLGWFTLLAARCVGAAGRVFAFEPSPDVYEHLRENLRLNGSHNVTAEQLALFNRGGVALLSHSRPRHSGTASLFNKDPLAREVEVVTLDEYRSRLQIGAIRLIKIDVEGAEMEVLLGGQRTFAERVCECILIEVDEDHLHRRGLRSSDLLGQLRDWGYRLFRIGVFGRREIDTREPVAFANILARAER
jgi:FkbM family methyltransferase